MPHPALKPGGLRALAYVVPCPVRNCAAPVGRSCMSFHGGQWVPPHAARVKAGRAYGPPASTPPGPVLPVGPVKAAAHVVAYTVGRMRTIVREAERVMAGRLFGAASAEALRRVEELAHEIRAALDKVDAVDMAVDALASRGPGVTTAR